MLEIDLVASAQTSDVACHKFHFSQALRASRHAVSQNTCEAQDVLCGRSSCGHYAAEARNRSHGLTSNMNGSKLVFCQRRSMVRRASKRFRFGVLAAAGDNGADNGVFCQGDQLLRSISMDAEISIITIVATEVVQDAQRRHKTSPTASAALGRALIGTLLLGAIKGVDETVQVNFVGQGPLGQMTTLCSRDSMVKGFVGNPLCEIPLKSNGKLDVGSAVGTGILTVVRNNPNWREPYSGTIPIYSGEVAEDIAHYLADSEQQNIALGVGVAFNRDTAVRFAGGFLVQVLPFCSSETLAQLEQNILNMPPLSDSDGLTAKEISDHLLVGIGAGDYDNLPTPKFGPCSVEELKPRMVRAVASLGLEDVKEILAEQGHVEVKCEFCAEVVRFGEADLQEILRPSSRPIM